MGRTTCPMSLGSICMQVNFIAQPDIQLGTLITSALSTNPGPRNVVLVSAFTSLQAVLRLKSILSTLHTNGSAIRLVVGVDMGGTSKDVLKELESWPLEVFVFKNKRVGVTFHPKLYVIETAQSAEIFLGSNNLTDGGLYGNYEGAVQVSYQLPSEEAEFRKAMAQLRKFINPTAPVGRRLDKEYLELLLLRRDIPDEAEARRQRAEARRRNESTEPVADIFGYESTARPPRLPIELQQVVLAAVRDQLDALNQASRQTKVRKQAIRKQAIAGSDTSQAAPATESAIDIRNFKPLAQLLPESFFLELTATSSSSSTIPGEQRVPLEAINAAQEFWGWPDRYTESRNPRKGSSPAGEDRVYLNWKPKWRLRKLGSQTEDIIKDIRMYFYQNSSDYRFYSSDLVRWATAGDMIRLTRCEGLDYEYECVLAVKGTPEHAEWRSFCTQGSPRSPRVFAFA